MKTWLCALLPLVFAASIHADDLSKHVVFKHYLGKWIAAGELKGEDGSIVTVAEDWEGKAEGENTFVIEGTRTLNKDTQPFKWTFTLNPATGGCEAFLTGSDGGQALRFEVNISDVNLTLDMKALTGATAAIMVKEEFKDEKRDAIVSHVTFVNDEGKTTLDGDITHKKVPPP